jgi:hypothetical protein
VFVDAPSFPLTEERPQDMDNATLARRALLDLNSEFHAKRGKVAPHWSPNARPDVGFHVCLVGMTVEQESRLAQMLTYGSLSTPFVAELEGRFEGRIRYPDEIPMPRLTAPEAARATGWRR